MTDVRHDGGRAGPGRDTWVEPGQDLDALLTSWGAAQDGPFKGGRHTAGDRPGGYAPVSLGPPGDTPGWSPGGASWPGDAGPDAPRTGRRRAPEPADAGGADTAAWSAGRHVAPDSAAAGPHTPAWSPGAHHPGEPGRRLDGGPASSGEPGGVDGDRVLRRARAAGRGTGVLRRARAAAGPGTGVLRRARVGAGPGTGVPRTRTVAARSTARAGRPSGPAAAGGRRTRDDGGPPTAYWPAGADPDDTGGRRARPDHVPPPAWAASVGRAPVAPAPNGPGPTAPAAALHQALLTPPPTSRAVTPPSLADTGEYAQWLSSGAPAGVAVLDRPRLGEHDLLTHDPYGGYTDDPDTWSRRPRTTWARRAAGTAPAPAGRARAGCASSAGSAPSSAC